ncbi:MAG: serine hydrolase [Eubacteriales bacterium]|nr:serine hydrolase [Eubacteriales bacterium]
MKLKLLCLLLATCGMLSACGSGFDNKYNISELDVGKVYSNEEGLKADGFAASLCVPESDEAFNTDGVNAEAFALFDITDKEIISQKNSFEKVYPASTTKILTCLVALENSNLDDIVTVPKESEITVSGSSMAALRPGDQLSMRDLLYGLMVPSGNDAAVAIAHHISGSIDSFSKLMNEKAVELGATHSNFINPHGLPDDNHYTTVYDMYLIFQEALKNKDFLEIANKKEYTATVTSADGQQREVVWKNGNGFLSGKFTLPEGISITAGKTGHTSKAGFCLVLAEKDTDGHEYISIVMKAPVYEELYSGMSNLISKGK